LMMRIIKWLIRHWMLVLGFWLGVAATLFFIGFTHFSFNLTGTNEFCGKCHEMLPQVSTWKMASHVSNAHGVVANCVDCHLPPSGIRHYTYKAYSGLRDVTVHYLGDPSKVNWAGKAFTKSNYLFEKACLKCHQNLTPPGLKRGGFLAHREWMNGRTSKKCWDCHQNMVHHTGQVIYAVKQ